MKIEFKLYRFHNNQVANAIDIGNKRMKMRHSNGTINLFLIEKDCVSYG